MIFRYFVYKLVINWTSHCSNSNVLYSKLLGTCTEGYLPEALAVVVEASVCKVSLCRLGSHVVSGYYSEMPIRFKCHIRQILAKAYHYTVKQFCLLEL